MMQRYTIYYLLSAHILELKVMKIKTEKEYKKAKKKMLKISCGACKDTDKYYIYICDDGKFNELHIFCAECKNEIVGGNGSIYNGVTIEQPGDRTLIPCGMCGYGYRLEDMIEVRAGEQPICLICANPNFTSQKESYEN